MMKSTWAFFEKDDNDRQSWLHHYARATASCVDRLCRTLFADGMPSDDQTAPAEAIAEILLRCLCRRDAGALVCAWSLCQKWQASSATPPPMRPLRLRPRRGTQYWSTSGALACPPCTQRKQDFFEVVGNWHWEADPHQTTSLSSPLLSPPLLDADAPPAPPIVVLFCLSSRGQANTHVCENSPSLAALPPTRPLLPYFLGEIRSRSRSCVAVCPPHT